jgi:hypothetical protein
MRRRLNFAMDLRFSLPPSDSPPRVPKCFGIERRCDVAAKGSAESHVESQAEREKRPNLGVRVSVHREERAERRRWGE